MLPRRQSLGSVMSSSCISVGVIAFDVLSSGGWESYPFAHETSLKVVISASVANGDQTGAGITVCDVMLT